MEILCGPKIFGNGSLEDDTFKAKFKYSCGVEMVAIVSATIFFFTSIIITVFIRCRAHHGKMKEGSVDSKFFGHYLRAFTIIFMFVIHIMELGEYIAASEYGLLPRHAVLSSSFSICILIIGTIFHSTIENKRMMKYSLIQIGYWFVCFLCRIFRIKYLTEFNLGFHHARFVLAIITCSGFAFLTVLDMLSLVIEIPLSFSSPKRNNKNECDEIGYKHNKSSAYSQMIFWWLNKLLWNGYKDPLEIEDLGKLPSDTGNAIYFQKFLGIYEKELISSRRNYKSVSLWKCYFRYICKNYFIGGILKLLGDIVGLIGPLSISIIIEYAASYESVKYVDDAFGYPTLKEYFRNGYVVGIIVLISAIAQGTLSQSSTHLVNIEGIRLKSALQSLIYDKSLKLALWSSPNLNNISNQDENSTSKSLENTKEEAVDGGSITNLISEDSYNIMSFIWIGHYVWAIPLKIIVLMYFLYLKLGISAIIGATVCIFTMTPLQFWMGKSMSDNSKRCVEFSDQRMMMMGEILQGVKTLKMYAWENIYEEKIRQIRENELRCLNKDSLYWALITFLTHASSALITLVTFGLYFFIEGKDMSPANVFAGLALFNQLTVPLFIFPVTVPIFISALISTKRLHDYLMLPEVNILNKWVQNNMTMEHSNTTDTLHTLSNIEEMEEENDMEEIFKENVSEHDVTLDISPQVSNDSDNTCVVKLIETKFIWGTVENTCPKINISGCIKIPKGKLTMIVGKTDSGKSSFLSALIGEMNLIRGKLNWSRGFSLAYTPQKPWLMNGTIKENIIFGNTVITRRYKKVLSACALKADLTALTNKDQTEVGEAGNSLSGGQKQRICLARSIYSNADVLILDDPLAALDLPVAQKIFDKGIRKFCLQHNKTVIMVTNQLQLLQHADQIVYVDNGIVRSVGSLSDVEKMEPQLASEWKMLLLQNKMDNRERTAKDRWHLVKLVNKFSLHFKSKSDEEMDNKIESYSGRKRHVSFYGSRYFTHDLSLPTDECDDELIRNSLPKRLSLKRNRLKYIHKNDLKEHKVAERSSSLQVVKHKVKPAPMQRQISSPSIQCNPLEEIETISNRRSIEEHQKRYILRQLFPINSQKFIENQTDVRHVRQKSIIRRLLSVRNKKARSDSEREHVPIKRLISTNSTYSENDEDDFCLEKSIDKKASEEEREYGKIPKKVYMEYFKSCGLLAGFAYIISTIAWQIMRVYTDIWLSEWTNSENKNIHNSDIVQYLYLYSFLSMVSIILSLLSNAIGQYGGAVARKVLHAKLLSNIIKSPLTFFETTPFGRIINRFSSDIGIIDKKIATSMQRLLQFLFLCISGILINAFINPWFLLIIALPICVIYYMIQKFYRSSARELQRLDAITKSPIFSHFNETLNGLTSIRAFSRQQYFWNLLWNKMDVNMNSFIILNSCNRWLGIALDYLGGTIVFAAIIASLLTMKLYPETITPSLIGLAINYTLLIPIYLNWVVKFLLDMEMYMSAVERVQQYSSFTREDLREIDISAKKGWLQNGEIKFSNVDLRYGDTKEPVIKNFNLYIPAGQKIAICGRTGSGKSSLLLSLLSMVDICQGNVTIDGIDIKTIPLSDLRSSIAIVPQDVTLFTGTIRENLNPVKSVDDGAIWSIFDSIKFKDTISSYPGGLDGCITEGGSGWSGGARQIIGIVRSLLRNSPILLMDEPTAALDPQTEGNILPTLFKFRKNCTIITVAHRLSTIMDYDRVIILDAGCIVEDGNPKELLARPMSVFSTMAKSTD